MPTTDELYDRAVDCVADGDLEGAVAAYREALAADPEFADGWEGLSMALSDLGLSGLPDAEERFRSTADELVRAARDVLADEGRKATDAVLRDVATTLRSTAASDPDLLTSGRLTEPVESTGFEAMAGALPAARREPRRPSRDDRKAEKAKLAEARAALAEARDEARSRGREADRAEREARRARAEAEAAEQRVAEAEERLARLQS